MKFSFGYGTSIVDFNIPEENFQETVTAKKLSRAADGEEEVARSLSEPVGLPVLEKLARPGMKVTIITSDITRPFPGKLVIPQILTRLNAAGVPDKDIKIVFALGIHRKQTPEEQEHAVGKEIFNRITCVDSDKDDCVYMGKTRLGTPVHVYRAVAEADFRICAGNIEYHYFAGYSGGAKAMLPGVCSRETVRHNHRRMVDGAACAGRHAGNPVREDIDDAARLCSVDYIVNVVLDGEKKIIRCVAGHYLDAHRAGCACLDGLNRVTIQKKADIVITSPGGYPKDINMYQAQKALDNAKYAVKDGGCVIWVAQCGEGLGEETFERWMLGHAHPEEMIAHIRRDFQLGGHKAAAIAMMLRNTQIILVSDMDPELVRRMHMKPASGVQEAADMALRRMGTGAKVIVMPNGGSTLPGL